MIDQLLQFKDKPLNTNTAEAYAKIRLGLDENEWCACAWSCCIDNNDEPEFEEDEEYSKNIILDILYEARNSEVLPHQQMWVRLIKASNLEHARKAWDNKIKLEHKVCVIDWKLLQAFIR